MFIGLIWWKYKSYEHFKKGCKGHDFFIKSFGYFLYLLGSKILTLDANHMWKNIHLENHV